MQLKKMKLRFRHSFFSYTFTRIKGLTVKINECGRQTASKVYTHYIVQLQCVFLTIEMERCILPSSCTAFTFFPIIILPGLFNTTNGKNKSFFVNLKILKYQKLHFIIIFINIFSLKFDYDEIQYLKKYFNYFYCQLIIP